MPTQTAVDPREGLDTLAAVSQLSHPPGAAAPPGVPDNLGPFQILGMLGEGGSGVVYAARWGHREIALKVLHPTLIATDRERTRFFSEAKLLSEVTHPSVVKVLNVGALPDGRPYLAMEKLEGETLAARLARGPLAVDVALALFDQVAGAVAALHGGGLIHRDLKPENVMLTGGGDFAVLLDFGIAKELDAPASTVTQDGGVRGTPAYMAPERFFGQPANPRTDIYELGVLLYAMVTGALPWADHADPTARLNPRRPSDIGVTLPGRLEAELLVAISTRPESRPATVAELMRRLVQAYQGVATDSMRRTADISSPRSPLRAQPAQPTPRPAIGTTDTTAAQRKTWTMAAAGLAAIALVGGGVWLATRSDDSPSVVAAGSATSARDAGATEAATPDAADSVEKAAPAPVTDGTKTLLAARSGDDSGLATAYLYHPRGTRLLVGVRVRELLRSKAVGPMLVAQRDNPKLAALALLNSLCSVDFLADVDWATLGISDLESQEFDLIVAGNWNRAKIETCLSKNTSGGAGVERHGNLSLVKGAEPTWVGWIDDRTLFYSTRKGVTKSWMKARLARDKNLASEPRVATILERMKLTSTMWMIGDPDQVSAGSLMKGIPDPTTVYGGLVLGAELSGDVNLRYANPAGATSAHTMIGAELAKLRADPIGQMLLGKTKLTRDKRTVTLTVSLDKAMTSMMTMAVGEALKKNSQ